MLTAPISELILVLFDELAAAVSGAAVNDNPFVVSPCLADHAVVGTLQASKIVEVDGDDREFHDFNDNRPEIF